MRELRTAGLIVFFIGCILTFGYGVFKALGELFSDTTVPAVIVLGVIALVAGIIIMLIALIVERVRDAKKEEL